jgi:hypothetical protein
VRGMVLAQLQVSGPVRDVHSGAVSDPSRSPAMELCKAVAALHDDKGRVKLPGFNDDVAKP